MFSFLKSKKVFEPLNYEMRKYFEQNFLWLMHEFPEPEIKEIKMLVPTSEDFPISWNKSPENAHEALKIVCQNMQINAEMVELDFYRNGITEINMGSSVLFTEADPEMTEAAGLYHREKQDGKSQISLEESLLENPTALIATMAHELAHVKLLDELKLDDNDELLTDFTTVYFGLGIFSANSAFQFYQETDRWGYRNLGYLKLEEWAYALALRAFAQHDDAPDWRKYLSKSITNDFNKSLNYLIENEEEIFKIEEE